jgi:hypothetical protein
MNINFPVLYVCGTWFVTLRDKRRLRVFEKVVVWKKFGLKREEVRDGWIKLHNEELCAVLLITKYY